MLKLMLSTLASLVSASSSKPEWFLSTSLLRTLLEVIQSVLAPPGLPHMPSHLIIVAFHILAELLRQKLGSPAAVAELVEMTRLVSQVLQVISVAQPCIVTVLDIVCAVCIAEYCCPKGLCRNRFRPPPGVCGFLSSCVWQPVTPTHRC